MTTNDTWSLGGGVSVDSFIHFFSWFIYFHVWFFFPPSNWFISLHMHFLHIYHKHTCFFLRCIFHMKSEFYLSSDHIIFIRWFFFFFLSCDISVLWGCDISIRVLGQWQWVLSTIIVHVHTVWMVCKVCAEMIRMQFNSMFHGSWRTSANSQS